MKELPFGPTAPRVTEFQIKEELNRIDKEIEPRILTFEIPVTVRGSMAYDEELDTINVSLPWLLNDISAILSYFPDTDWRAHLRRTVDHELAHKNQTEFLLNRGISVGQLDEPHYIFLTEFQARNAVPMPIESQVLLQELREAPAEKIEAELERPNVWIVSATSFPREDIREIFDPYGVVEYMLQLKDIAEKVRTKEDILKYVPETMEWFGLPQKEELNKQS